MAKKINMQDKDKFKVAIVKVILDRDDSNALFELEQTAANRGRFCLALEERPLSNVEYLEYLRSRE